MARQMERRAVRRSKLKTWRWVSVLAHWALRDRRPDPVIPAQYQRCEGNGVVGAVPPFITPADDLSARKGKPLPAV
ncbi:hypothetical protein SKAU_G00257820 [Synaphobranchus kaupii]|uniref:Uncharacterized protein n=1 Tax=Synaphobranchus kaupii TaxID=118154 RepID=A0A9Q1F440_SYNKA|nr:hypothetical protein SKAU_G00257820 [Synaphobranchus kaupii]